MHRMAPQMDHNSSPSADDNIYSIPPHAMDNQCRHEMQPLPGSHGQSQGSSYFGGGKRSVRFDQADASMGTN